MATTSAAHEIPGIFLDDSGEPFHVFVDSSISGASQVIRQLKKLGAVLSHSPRGARFIISDSNSESRCTYIRKWGKDSSKTVLDRRWVAKCAQARRLLHVGDDWGGCAIKDDSITFEDDQQADDTPKAKPSLDTQSPTDPSNLTYRTAETLTQSEAFLNPQSSSTSAQSAALNASFVSASYPDSGNYRDCTVLTSGQPVVTMPQFLSQAVPWQTPSQMSANSSSWNVPMAGQMCPQGNLLSSFLPASQSGMVSFPPMSSSALPANQEFIYGTDTSRFLMALADIYRANAANLLNPQLNLVITAPQFTNLTNPSPFSSMPNPESPRLFTANEGPAAKTEELCDSSSTPLPDVKGKRRATSPQVSSSHQVPTSPSRKTKIFVRDGSALMFFVQIDLSQRHSIVGKIKSHGGSITSVQQDADYSILSSRSKTFRALLKTAVASNALVIKPSFVTDCVDSGELLDISKYLLEIPDKLEQRILVNGVTTEKTAKVKKKLMRTNGQNRMKGQGRKVNKLSIVESPRGPPREFSPPSSRPLPEHTHEQLSVVGSPSIPRKVSTNRPSSPPPPPEHTYEQHSSGKYLYSLAEREYIFRYVRFLFDQDYQLPASTIAQKLHAKMPHHTLKSWNTTINQGQIRDEIELLRKRAGIAHRKMVWQRGNLHQEQQGGSASTTKPNTTTEAQADMRKAEKRRKLNSEDNT